MAPPPLKKFREKGVQIAAWATQNGGISFTIDRCYKAKDGEFKKTNTYFIDSLKALRYLIDQVVQWEEDNTVEGQGEQQTKTVQKQAFAKTEGPIQPSPFDDSEILF